MMIITFNNNDNKIIVIIVLNIGINSMINMTMNIIVFKNTY